MPATTKKMNSSKARALMALALIAAMATSTQAEAYKPSPSVRSSANTQTVVSARLVPVSAPALLAERPADAPLLVADRSARRASWFKRTMAKLSPKRSTSRFSRLVRMVTARPKAISARKAASLIKPGTQLFTPLGHSVAASVLNALGKRAKDPKGGLNADKPVEIVGLSNTISPKLFDRAGKVVPHSLFLAGNTREAVNAGRGSFVPVFLSRIPGLIRKGSIKVDTALVQVSKPDKMGYVTLGSTAGVTLAALEKAKTIIAEVNPNVPRTHGATKIHISQLDYVVPSRAKQVEVPPAPVSDVEKAIAKHVTSLIPKKNPTLQFGIGGIPNAVAGELAAAGRKDIRVHSEMISDGVMQLVKSGAVRGKVRYSFAMGSGKFLKWMDKNRKLEAKPSDFVNDPARIGKLQNMVAINSAFSVDLKGQVNAQYRKGDWYSGVGGQVDFMRGAMASKNGRAILALPATFSTKDKQGNKVLKSRIKANLGSEDVVTTSMHDVQYVVTEFGVASLDGKTAVQRAKALIKVAHPQFRAELTAQLDREMGGRKGRADAAAAKRSAAKRARNEAKPGALTATANTL